MAQYDATDFARRLRQALTLGWFPVAPAVGEAETAPLLQSVLMGAGTLLAGMVSLFSYVKAQTRISTATDSNLDLISIDYFGPQGLPRQSGESDVSFRARIKSALLPTLGTRAAVVTAITDVTGSAPLVIVEPRSASDTKGRGSLSAPGAGGGYGYGSPGLRYGSLTAPYQMFLEVNYPQSQSSRLFAAINRARALPTIVWTAFNS